MKHVDTSKSTVASDTLTVVSIPTVTSIPTVNTTTTIFSTICFENIHLILDNLAIKRWTTYDTWIKIGMILRNMDCQLELWDEYSKKSKSYEEGECRKKWFSFTKKGVGLGTLIALLKEDSIETFNLLMSMSNDASRIKHEADDAEYLELKTKWEQTHFYLRATNTIIEVSGNTVEHFGIEHAKSAFNNEYKFKTTENFISKWMLDKDRRTYNNITFAPSTSHNYSTYKGMLYESFEVDDDAAVFDAFNDLLDSVTNKVPENKNFVLNWLAHLVQQPFVNPGTALIFTGKNGVGKDTLSHFIGSYILGDALYINYTNESTFWSEHETGRDSKLLVSIEEASASLNIKYASALKSRITSHKEIFNPKGTKSYSIDNYARYILTSNEATPILLEGMGDRRFFLCPCGTFAQDDKQFWDNIYDVLMKPESGAIIGKYLAQIDISAFNPRKALLTEYAKIALTEAKSSEICFIESNAWNGEEINTSDLYVIYKNFCVNHHLQYAKSTKSFGMKLMGLVRNGLIFKGRNAESRTYTKKTIGDTPP